jgi:hypothetical protein
MDKTAMSLISRGLVSLREADGGAEEDRTRDPLDLGE